MKKNLFCVFLVSRLIGNWSIEIFFKLDSIDLLENEALKENIIIIVRLIFARSG